MSSLRVFLALLACASTSLAGELHTMAGKTITGDMVSISDKEIVFRGSAGQIATPMKDVLLVEFQHDGAAPNPGKITDVELTDGTLLHCSQVALKGKELELKLGASTIVKVPLTTVSYILNDAEDAAIRQEWQDKHLPKKGNQDILAIKLNGVINALEGTLGEGNEKGEISFEYQSGGNQKKRAIDLSRVQGMIFVRSLNGAAPSTLCKIMDVNQNVWMASSLSLGANSFAISTVAGAKVDLPRAAVVRLDFNNDKIVFLSDLKPVEVIEKSKQGRKDNVHADKNLENSSLQMKGEAYSKGLALHAHTELVYALDSKYKKFQAVLGMDDGVGGDGQPLVKIEVDGKELLSQIVTRKDERRDLNFDVSGVKQLRIVVTSNRLLDFGDHIDLANAKLSK